MAAGDGWESRLITGLAEHLAAAGIGVWRPTGTYLATEVAIIDRGIPSTPDQIITLTDYVIGGSARTRLADITVGIQIRLRGTTDPRVVRDLGAEIFDLLDQSGRQTWGTAPAEVSIVDVWRPGSAGSLGDDDNGRWQTVHNYYVDAMRPTAHRTD